MTGEPRRKLVEAALPLEAINAACKADKERKTGTIRNLHKWFAPMPSPAWRALLFATLVDDPGDEAERDRLWRLIEELVESGPVPPPADVLARARDEIRRSNPDGLPLVADPFCGAGSTLVEAQRLGLPAFGSDLNPVAVLITRMLCELLPAAADKGAFAGSLDALAVGSPLDGFVADIEHYAEEVRSDVWEGIGHLFPRRPNGGTPFAWLWARTVTCPNPACRAETPLATSWWLSKKKGEEAWIEPVVRDGSIGFEVGRGNGGPPPAPKVGRGADFKCVACGSLISSSYLADEGKDGGLGLALTAAVSSVGGGRSYEPGDEDQRRAALEVEADVDLSHVPVSDGGSRERFGCDTYQSLFLPRQLRAIDYFARAVGRVRERVFADAGEEVYATAVTTFLGLCVGKLAQHLSTQVRWRIDSRNGLAKAEAAFGRHDLPMTWDFVETNPFGGSVGDWKTIVTTASRAVPLASSGTSTKTRQQDARTVINDLPQAGALVATDPPYFGQIAYADLSDYFYVWLRRALRDVHPDLFGTLMSPREGELVALPTRHQGDRRAAYDYFVQGFTATFNNLRATQRPDLPMLVVYAHREEEGGNGGRGGWEAMLDAILRSGFSIVGTLPLRGTGAQRMVSLGTNALATYVVMVCRPRPTTAQRIPRRDLDRLMRRELHGAVADLQSASTAPVDLAQAVIGPGMAIFSRYAAVLEADGTPMTVGSALQLINRTLGEVLDEQETDLDADSRWAAAWLDQHGYDEGRFGDADSLSRSKGISVDALVRAGIVGSSAGKVRLLARHELTHGWDPQADYRPTAWEAVQHLARRLELEGEEAAAALWARLGTLADPARELAYRLFQVCERRGWTAEAVALNGLVVALPDIARLAEAIEVEDEDAVEQASIF